MEGHSEKIYLNRGFCMDMLLYTVAFSIIPLLGFSGEIYKHGVENIFLLSLFGLFILFFIYLIFSQIKIIRSNTPALEISPQGLWINMSLFGTKVSIPWKAIKEISIEDKMSFMKGHILVCRILKIKQKNGRARKHKGYLNAGSSFILNVCEKYMPPEMVAVKTMNINKGSLKVVG
jgi:hypothetical protein